MAFDLKTLVPVSSIDTLGKVNAGGRSTKLVALDNIKKQIELIDPNKEGKRSFWDTVADGKRSYTGKGSHVGFSLRVANKALKLHGDLTEAAVPKAQFKEALEAFAKEIEADKMKDQLDALDTARTARTNKMRETRAGKAKK